MLSVSPLEALIAGLLQGFLEWLPISSEGVTTLTLIALGHGGMAAINLSITLHISTSIAALIYFHKPLIEDIKGERRLLRLLSIATSITILTALPLYRALSLLSALGAPLQLLIGLALISTGLLMRLSGRRGKRRRLDLWESLALGVVQGFAVIPGVSRSGITLTYLLLRGLEPSEAFSLAYMLGIPIGLLAPMGLAVLDSTPPLTFPLFIALLSALAVALPSMELLLRAAGSRRIWLLCLTLGILTILCTALEGW